MRNFKTAVTALFRRKKERKLTITFTSNDNGTTTTGIKADKSIGVNEAVRALDEVKALVVTKLAKRCSEGMYKPSDPKRRVFISRQTMGDIL